MSYKITDTEVNIPERSTQTYDYVLHGTIQIPGTRPILTRVLVHRDNHPPQSHAVVEVYDRHSLRWNEIVSPLPTTVTAGTPDPYARDRGEVEKFARVYAEALFRQADALLNGTAT